MKDLKRKKFVRLKRIWRPKKERGRMKDLNRKDLKKKDLKKPERPEKRRELV